MIKEVEDKIAILHASKHRLSDDDVSDCSDNYQDNLEIGYEIVNLYEELDGLENLRSGMIGDKYI